MTEDEAWVLFETLRWGAAPHACPHCGRSGGCRYLPPAGGDRLTTRGTRTARRVWRCSACRQQFSVLTGTVLERTRIPLRTWHAVAADDAPGSARGFARAHGLTPETARVVLARLRAVGVPGPGEDAAAALRRLLRLPPQDVARVLAATPARHTPPRTGPSADYR